MELQHFTGTERRLIDALEQMPESFIFFSPDGRIQYANARSRELLRSNGNPTTLRGVIGPEADSLVSRSVRSGAAPLQFRSVLKDAGTGERVFMSLLRSPEGTVTISGNLSGPVVEGYAYMYNAIFRWSSDAMFVLCASTRRLIDVSDRACMLTGYSHDELLGKRFDDLVSPDQLDEAGKLIEGVEPDRTISARMCLIGNRDQPVIVDANIRLVQFNGQRVLLASVRDITELERQEAELRKRNSELSALNYISTTASSTLDLSEVLSRSIVKTCEVTGIPMGCIFLMQAGVLVPSSYKGVSESFIKGVTPLKIDECAEGKAVLYRTPEVVEDLRQYGHVKCDMHLQSGIRSLVSVPIIYRDEVIGVMDLATPDVRRYTAEEIRLYQSIANTIAGAINNASYVRQINRQKNELAELVDRLRRSNEQLRLTYNVQTRITSSINLDETLDAIIENAPMMVGLNNCVIFTVDEGEITEIRGTQPHDKAAGQIRFRMDELIATKEAMENRRAIVIEDALLYPRISQRLVHLLGARTCIIIPLAARDKVLGAMWLYDTRGPRAYSEEDLAGASALSSQASIALDNALLFQELSRAKGELEDSYERLKSLDRMKMEFFTIISHELRTPLTTIKGYSELLKDGILGPVNEEQRDRLTKIDASVDRLTSIVENLSDISGMASKQFSGKKLPVSLNELIDEVVRGITFIAETKRIPIALDVPLKLPIIYADRGKIEQVLLNILNNAIKYTPDGGRISVTARDEDDHLLVAVHDTGIGIPARDLENIFSGFYHAGYKLSYEYKGVGLGLAISRRIIEGHGGKIWAESEPGRGSTFFFTLPKQAPRS